MSQYMICRTKNDLRKYGGYILGEKNKNDLLVYEVVEYYFKEFNSNEIWVIEPVKRYCVDCQIVF